jgi:hypothetical protein
MDLTDALFVTTSNKRILSFTMNVCFHPSDPEQATPGLREEQSSDLNHFIPRSSKSTEAYVCH